jgi:hypothetical protein
MIVSCHKAQSAGIYDRCKARYEGLQLGLDACL